MEFDLTQIEFQTVPPFPINMKSTHMNSILYWINCAKFGVLESEKKQRKRLESNRKRFDWTEKEREIASNNLYRLDMLKHISINLNIEVILNFNLSFISILYFNLIYFVNVISKLFY